MLIGTLDGTPSTFFSSGSCSPSRLPEECSSAHGFGSGRPVSFFVGCLYVGRKRDKCGGHTGKEPFPAPGKGGELALFLPPEPLLSKDAFVGRKKAREVAGTSFLPSVHVELVEKNDWLSLLGSSSATYVCKYLLMYDN